MMEWIVVSGHAAERWHQRTDSPGVGPIIAWSESERRELEHVSGDEVRYQRATKTLLVRKGNVLVTVLGAADATRQTRQEIYGQRGEPA